MGIKNMKQRIHQMDKETEELRLLLSSKEYQKGFTDGLETGTTQAIESIIDIVKNEDPYINKRQLIKVIKEV